MPHIADTVVLFLCNVNANLILIDSAVIVDIIGLALNTISQQHIESLAAQPIKISCSRFHIYVSAESESIICSLHGLALHTRRNTFDSLG